MAPTSITVPEQIDADSIRRLRDRLARAGTDTETAIITLVGGSNGIFCEGLHFSALRTDKAPRAAMDSALEAFAECLHRLHFGGKPTLALVDGVTRGGGIGIAAACDVVLATDRSRFALPEILFGLAPAIVWPVIRDRMTAQRCRLWALTGESRTAAEARDDGLIDDVVSLDRFKQRSSEWLRRLSRGRRSTVATLKELATRDAANFEGALRSGCETTARALRDPELVRAMVTFDEAGVLPWEDP